MEQELQSCPGSLIDPRVVIKLPIDKKVDFLNKRDRLGMSSSQFLMYLLEEYEGNNLAVIKNFRYNLSKRIKKGINRQYINELTKLRDQLNITLNRLQ